MLDINIFNSVPIVVGEVMCAYDKWVQFRFPKSKKKRIRKKWAKRRINYRYEKRHRMFEYEGRLYVSRLMYDKLMEEAL